jgi:hypothetical protein
MEWRDRRMRLQIDPKKDIKDACESNNYFTAFALASSYFEYEANLIFGTRFENRISLKKIGRWSLQTKIRLLFGLNMLDHSTYEKISEIIKIRNKLVHPVNIWEKGRMLDIFLSYRLTEREKSSLLSFNECYSKLVEVHSRTLDEKSRRQ